MRSIRTRRGGPSAPPAVRPHSTPLAPQLPSRPHPKNSNRESQRLGTLVTHRKQNTGPTSNREKRAVFQRRWAPNVAQVFSSEAFRLDAAPGSDFSSTSELRGELEKHKIAPPIFVAIKNHPDPLFRWSYV
jgi:hypothetical protein